VETPVSATSAFSPPQQSAAVDPPVRSLPTGGAKKRASAHYSSSYEVKTTSKAAVATTLASSSSSTSPGHPYTRTGANRRGSATSTFSTASQLSASSQTIASSGTAIVPATLRSIEEEGLAKKEEVDMATWEASGELNSVQSVKELLAHCESQLLALRKRYAGLCGEGDNKTGGATSTVERLDPITGFAVNNQGSGMGLLQLVIVGAVDIPARRQSKSCDPYVEIEIALSEDGERALYRDVEGCVEREAAADAKFADLLTTMQPANSTVARTTVMQQTLFPVWREALTLTGLQTLRQEVHIRVKDRRRGVWANDETLVDCALPLAALADQADHRLHLSLGRPTGVHAGAQAKVRPHCALTVKARLAYSRQGLVQKKIGEMKRRIVLLQTRLADLGGDAPASSWRKGDEEEAVGESKGVDISALTAVTGLSNSPAAASLRKGGRSAFSAQVKISKKYHKDQYAQELAAQRERGRCHVSAASSGLSEP
jgi:hypothetical protein